MFSYKCCETPMAAEGEIVMLEFTGDTQHGDLQYCRSRHVMHRNILFGIRYFNSSQ